MIETGTWMVFCPRARALPMAELARRLELPSECTARLDGEVLVVTVANDGDPVDMQITLSMAPHVVAEAAELAAELGADRPDRELSARCDARYEISWPAERVDAVIGDYHTLALRVAALCDGAIFDALAGELVKRR